MQMDIEIIQILGATLMYAHAGLFALTSDSKYGIWAILGAILMNYGN